MLFLLPAVDLRDKVYFYNRNNIVNPREGQRRYLLMLRHPSKFLDNVIISKFLKIPIN